MADLFNFAYWISSSPYPRAPFERAMIEQMQPERLPQRDELEARVLALERRLNKIERGTVGFIKINLLPTKTLRIPLDAIVEPDNGGFVARTPDIPLYGYGDDPLEAIDALKCEIESLYDDLMQDDEFTEEWLKIKEFLRERIIDR